MENPSFKRFSYEVKDIIWRMLAKSPTLRMTPQQALVHPFFIKNGFGK